MYLPLNTGIYKQQLQPLGHRYTLSIPEEYRSDQPTPMILALHWGGPVKPYTGEQLLLGLIRPALGELGAIMVAPDLNRSDWDNPQSEEEVLNLLNYVQTNYDIDPSRMLVTGYSLGAIGTWRLAAHHQDKFTAALPVSANPPEYVIDTDWHLPIYVIHGQQDQYFPIRHTQMIVDQLRSNGGDIEFIIVQDGTHFKTDVYVKPLHDAIPWIRRVWNTK